MESDGNCDHNEQIKFILTLQEQWRIYLLQLRDINLMKAHTFVSSASVMTLYLYASSGPL